MLHGFLGSFATEGGLTLLGFSLGWLVVRRKEARNNAAAAADLLDALDVVVPSSPAAAPVEIVEAPAAAHPVSHSTYYDAVM